MFGFVERERPEATRPLCAGAGVIALCRCLACLPHSRRDNKVIFISVFFFYLFFLLSWKFQRRTLLETSSKDRPYWWSLSSTKMTTGPFSKRHITREKCLRDPQQVGDIDALKGPRGERSCYWISPDSNITLAVVALLLLALDSMSVVLFFSSFLSFMKLLASMYRWACEGLVDCWRLSLLGFS